MKQASYPLRCLWGQSLHCGLAPHPFSLIPLAGAWVFAIDGVFCPFSPKPFLFQHPREAPPLPLSRFPVQASSRWMLALPSPRAEAVQTQRMYPGNNWRAVSEPPGGQIFLWVYLLHAVEVVCLCDLEVMRISPFLERTPDRIGPVPTTHH